jgi:hypothetical protein
MGGIVKGAGSALSGLGKTVGGFVGDPLGHGAIESGMGYQRDAGSNANAFLAQQYAQQRKDFEPWQQAGVRALTGLESADFQRDFTANDFEQDPGYAFRMAEGQKALERSAAARGGLLGGGFGKALTKYGQDFASNEFKSAYDRFNADRDRRFGRLSSIAGMGQNAVSGLVNASGNYGNQVAGNITGVGNALAAGNIAKANANQQLLSGLISAASKSKGKPETPNQGVI